MRVVVDADANAKAATAAAEWLRTDIGPQIHDRADRYCPRDTGNLAEGVEDHMEGLTLVVSADRGGRDDRSIAAFLELGHRQFHPSTGETGPQWVQARPFLRPALYSTLGPGWAGPIGSAMPEKATVMWRPEFGFGGDVRDTGRRV